MNPDPASLSPDARYDDQGLYFTLILGAVLLGSFVTATLALHLLPIFWLRRLYRPNHTALKAISPPSGGTEGREEDIHLADHTHAPHHHYHHHLRSPSDQGGSPTTPTTQHAPVQHSERAATRRMRHVGVSLPYRATILTLPSWRDWWSIEESQSVHHLESGLALPHTAPQQQPQTRVGRRKTPLDPQVALYLYTLKYFLMLMLGGSFITVWIAVIASQDDFIEATELRLDLHHCHMQDNNATGCQALAPHCTYLGEDIGCTQVPLHGLYDLTVANIRPASGRWWGVALLNVAYCALFVILTVLYVRRVGAYMERVMHNQLRHALGYRVACVLGLDAHEVRSEEAFRELYLTEASYFPRLHGESTNTNNNSTNRVQAQRAEGRSDDAMVLRRAEDEPLPAVASSPHVSEAASREADTTGNAAHSPQPSLNTTQSTTMSPLSFATKDPAAAAEGQPIAASTNNNNSNNNSNSAGEDTTTTTLVEVLHEAAAGPHQPPRPATAMVPYHISDEAYDEYEDEDEDEYYEQVECSGLNCLFSVVGCYYYYLRRRDAVFTLPGQVHEILFTRTPPAGIYHDIRQAEKAMADLQEAIADEKALNRLPHTHHSNDGGGGDGGEESNAAAPHRSTSVVLISSEALDAHTTPTPPPPPVPEMTPLLVRAPFPSCCCRHIEAVPYYEARFRRAAAKLNRKLLAVPRQKRAGPLFVVFADSLCAFEFVAFFYAKRGGFFAATTALIAGPPGRIIRTNLQSTRIELVLRFLFFLVLFVVLLFTWSIPVGFLGSLDNIALIPGIGPAMNKAYLEHVPEWLRNIATAYLPVIVLALFNVVLPFIIRFIVTTMGAFNKAECDVGHLYLQYLFMVLTGVIFQAALQGGIAQLANLIADTSSEVIVNFFVACISPVGGYWYAKIIMAATLTVWVDFIDPLPLLKALLLRQWVSVQRHYDDLFAPCHLELPQRYSFDLTILAMGLLFHMTAPLLSLFVAFYFIVRFFTQRARLYDRYRPTLAPAHDCTNGGLPAQVIRCTASLYCTAEVGAVLLMSLRRHVGGVMVCSVTVVVAFAMLFYVHVKSATWIVSLHTARRLLGADYGLAQQQRQQQTTGNNNAANESVLASSAEASHSASSAAAAGASSTTTTTTTATPAASPGNHAHSQSSEKEDEMSLYEDPHLSLFTGMYGGAFVSHMLPRKPGVNSRYAPKHQRLAILDIDAEVGRMKSSEYRVRRYWNGPSTPLDERSESEEGSVFAPPSTVVQSAHEGLTPHEEDTALASPLPLERHDRKTKTEGKPAHLDTSTLLATALHPDQRTDNHTNTTSTTVTATPATSRRAWSEATETRRMSGSTAPPSPNAARDTSSPSPPRTTSTHTHKEDDHPV